MRRAAALLALLLAGAAGGAPSTERHSLRLDDGRELPVELRRPAEAPGRLPAIMLFGGFRGAASVLDKVQQDVPGTQGPLPVIWASFDYPFEPPRKFVFPRSLRHAPQARDAIHGSFEGVVKLHEYLKSRADVDAARLTVVGASAGAPFATVGAARAGIPGLVLVQGFGDVREVIAHQISRKYVPKWGRWVKGPAWLLAAWIHWYCGIPSIEDHAAQLGAGQRVLMVTALDDDFIPREHSDALWTALERSAARRARLLLPGAHLGRGDDSAQIADIMRRALAWMQREDLLPSTVSKGD